MSCGTGIRGPVVLLIEIADSRFVFDRGEKAELYAEAGIVEYGVVNVAEHVIHMNCDPSRGGYRSTETAGAGTRSAPLVAIAAKLDSAEPFV